MVRQKFSKVRHFQLTNGFTLIEILVVMAIIGMLAVMLPRIFLTSKLARNGTQLCRKYRRLRRH